MKSSPDVVSAFASLGNSDTPSSEAIAALEEFVCQLYEPGTFITNVGDLRWRLFTKKQSEAQKLPPTRGAFEEAIARAHYQAMVWNQDDVPDPQLPPATDFGWKMEDDGLVAISTKQLPAPICYHSPS